MGNAKDYYMNCSFDEIERLRFDYDIMPGTDFMEAYGFTKQSIKRYLVELPQKYPELLTSESSTALLQMSVSSDIAKEFNQTLDELSKKLGVNRYLFADAVIREGIDTLSEKSL